MAYTAPRGQPSSSPVPGHQSAVTSAHRSEANAAATENAVAALGRVLAYSASALPDQGPQLADLWLHALPLTDDKQEAVGQHELLVDFLEKSDPR